LLPETLLHAIGFQRIRHEKRYRDLTTRQIFTRIYEEHTWGRSSDRSQQFFSGNGSHDTEIVAAYIAAVQAFLASLDDKPNVVDLGCGDFHVGSNIRASCGNYIACDIVPSLIEFNKKRFEKLNVDFRVLDLVEDDLPAADVVFVRQVLQHLSNREILSAIPKIESGYKFLVLTEHLPGSENFVPNRDKPTGPSVRPALGSGIVLTKPPFSLSIKAQRVLCEIPEHESSGGIIRTTLYQLS